MKTIVITRYTYRPTARSGITGQLTNLSKLYLNVVLLDHDFGLQLSAISGESGGPEVRVEGVPRPTSTFWATALLVAAYAAIFALGLIGNSLVILTLTRNKRVKVCQLDLSRILII